MYNASIRYPVLWKGCGLFAYRDETDFTIAQPDNNYYNTNYIERIKYHVTWVLDTWVTMENYVWSINWLCNPTKTIIHGLIDYFLMLFAPESVTQGIVSYSSSDMYAVAQSIYLPLALPCPCTSPSPCPPPFALPWPLLLSLPWPLLLALPRSQIPQLWPGLSGTQPGSWMGEELRPIMPDVAS